MDADYGDLLSPRTQAEGAGKIDVVSVLVNEFGVQLRDARAVKWESNPLRDSPHILLEDGCLVSDQDPGIYFSIRARNNTLSSLLQGVAQAYVNCTGEDDLITSRDTRIREAHFNAVVAYSGAGKTTIGTDYPRLLRRFWSENGKCELTSLTGDEVVGFSKMMEDSWDYRCCLYHNIADYYDGMLAGVERRLLKGSVHDPYNKILALRFLYAAISKPVPDLSYEDFLELLPRGILDHLTFEDVLIFIRKGLNIVHDRPIFMSLFLDEIGCAEIVERRGGGDISWIQQVLSMYIHCVARSAKKTKVVPVMTVSCTRHEAASLRLTTSWKTAQLPVPVFPLQQQDCLDIVKDFFQRLSVALGGDGSFELNDHLRLCVTMAGGMPRLLGYMLRGMLTSHPCHMLSGEKLLDAARTFNHERMVETLRNSIKLNGWERAMYSKDAVFSVLITALRRALLGTTVHRSMPVIDAVELSSMRENNWGRLEERAFVALQVLDTGPVQEPDSCSCRVAFPPLLALALQETGADIALGLFPSAMESGFRDLNFLAFTMRLFRNGTFVPRGSAGLREIIPCAWGYHRGLVDVRLPCTEDVRLYRAEDCTPLTGLGLRASRMNRGGDFGLFCQGKGVFVFPDLVIVLQSGSSHAVKAPPSARNVFWACFSDLTGIAKLNQVDTSEFGPPPDGLGKDVLELLDHMEAAKGQGMEVETASNHSMQAKAALTTGTKLKLRYKSLEGFESEVEYSDEDNYPLDRIIYVCSTQEHLSADSREKIRSSDNPLLKRIVLRNQDYSYPEVYDLLCQIRHQVPFDSLRRY